MRGSSSEKTTRGAQVSRWLLAVAVAGLALAVGTVHTVTLCVVTVVLAAAATAAWWGAEPIRVRPAATVLLFTGVGLTAYTALQCVPMPAGWLAVIAPHNADVWARALSPLHEPGPRWVTISLDPVATRVEVLKGVAYLLAFVTALRVARRREGVGFLSAVIVATAIVLALAALLHPAFGARKLFGVFEAGAGIPDRHVAPLMNPNHLAAYLNVGFCLALASAVSPEPRVPRVIALAIALVLAGVQIWVASRGGVVTMLVGGLLVGGLAWAARSTWAARSKTGAPALGLSLVTGLAALAGVAMMAVSSEDAQGELLSADVSKLELFGQAMRMARAYLLFGAGRGSFASTFPEFRGAFANLDGVSLHVTFAQPENIVAQWATEWGAPLTLGAMISILWALRPTAALARSTTGAGAWAALVAVTVQNFVDFSSEIPGVVLTLVVSSAMVASGSVGRAPRSRFEAWSAAPRTVVLACISVAAIALGTSLPGLGRELANDQDDLHEAAITHPRPLPELAALVRGKMLRHPAEPYLPFLLGLRAAQERAPEAIAWLGATLERAPVYGPAHLVLARVVGTRSPAQARLEYRTAMEQAPELASVVMNEAPGRVGGYWDAMELVPDGKGRPKILELLIGALAGRLPATRVRLDETLAALAPDSLGPATRTATDAVEDIEVGDAAPWCVGSLRAQCAQTALTLAKKAQRLGPTMCTGYALHARVLIAMGQTKQGLDEIERATDTVTDRLPCLRQLVAVATRANDLPRVESSLDRIVRAGCSDPGDCVQNLIFVAQQEEMHGSPRRALATYKRAFEQAPDDDGLLAQMARLSAAAGLHAEALEDYKKLARRRPQDTSWAAAAAREEDAAMRETVGP